MKKFILITLIIVLAALFLMLTFLRADYLATLSIETLGQLGSTITCSAIVFKMFFD